MVEQRGSKEIYDKAQALWGQSDLARSVGNPEESLALLWESASLHELAFTMISGNKPLTKAVAGRTAAGLYYRLEDYGNAARMAELCLDTIMVPEKPDKLFSFLIHEGAVLEVIWEDACKKLGRPHPTNDMSSSNQIR